jgi:chromosome segregation ATPase
MLALEIVNFMNVYRESVNEHQEHLSLQVDSLNSQLNNSMIAAEQKDMEIHVLESKLTAMAQQRCFLTNKLDSLTKGIQQHEEKSAKLEHLNATLKSRMLVQTTKEDFNATVLLSDWQTKYAALKIQFDDQNTNLQEKTAKCKALEQELLFSKNRLADLGKLSANALEKENIDLLNRLWQTDAALAGYKLRIDQINRSIEYLCDLTINKGF